VGDVGDLGEVGTETEGERETGDGSSDKPNTIDIDNLDMLKTVLVSL